MPIRRLRTVSDVVEGNTVDFVVGIRYGCLNTFTNRVNVGDRKGVKGEYGILKEGYRLLAIA